MRGRSRGDRIRIGRVIPDNACLMAEFAQIARQRVNETIVIVDDPDQEEPIAVCPILF